MPELKTGTMEISDIAAQLETEFKDLSRTELETRQNKLHLQVVEHLVEMAESPQFDGKEAMMQNYMEVNFTNLSLYELYIHKQEINQKNIEEQNRFRKAGIFAEVSTTIAFKRTGFTVIPPALNEDYISGTDLFVIPPGQEEEGEVWAIQLKSRSEYENITVQDIKTGALSNETTHDMTYENYDDEERGIRAMLNYLEMKQGGPYDNHPEFVDHTIRPMIMYVPSGKDRPYNKHTAEPLAFMPDQVNKACELAVIKAKNIRKQQRANK